MRKFLLLIFIAVSLRLFAQTNVYHPFPDSDAVWTVHDDQSHLNVCCAHSKWDRSYIQKGDTTINSIQYNKLYKNEHHYAYDYFPPSGCNCDLGITTNIFIGGLRNDSIDRKVYFYDASGKQECLLYDFSLNIGDSIRDWNWWSYCQNASNIFIKIKSIDSVLVGAQYHKRFNINGGMMADSSVIEGVGSLTGLLGPYTFFENFNQLVCFSVLNQTMYLNPNASTSCGVVGVNEIESKFSFSISPNPSTGIFNINSSEKFQYSVYDVFGREVYQSTNPLINQSTALDLSSYPKGIYFVRIKANDKMFSRKIILQ